MSDIQEYVGRVHVRKDELVEWLEKQRENTLDGEQIDGQEFVSEDEQSGYEAAINDIVKVME